MLGTPSHLILRKVFKILEISPDLDVGMLLKSDFKVSLAAKYSLRLAYRCRFRDKLRKNCRNGGV